MKRAWRRAFLEELARRPTPFERGFIRIDLIERRPVLMAGNASPVGLEPTIPHPQDPQDRPPRGYLTR
jgi:hypothetical protein